MINPMTIGFVIAFVGGMAIVLLSRYLVLRKHYHPTFLKNPALGNDASFGVIFSMTAPIIIKAEKVPAELVKVSKILNFLAICYYGLFAALFAFLIYLTVLQYSAPAA